MMDNKVTIKFEVTDENKDHYVSESTFTVYDSFLDDIGRQLNTFLKQMTYPRTNDCIFMEDVTEEEIDALYEFLSDYRSKTKNTNRE